MISYFDANLLEVPTPAQAYYTQVTQPGPGGAPVVTHIYFSNGRLYSEVTHSDPERNVEHGPVRHYYPTGQLRLEYNAEAGKFHGYLRTYYADGRRKRNDLYDHGRLLKGQYFGPEGELVEPHVSFRQMPIFPGGNEALIAYVQQNLHYPEQALRNAVEGRVLVAFTVTANGTVADVRVQESVGPELDEAAMAVVRTLPAFDPGRLDGEPTTTPMLLPISFKAPETTKILRKLGF